MRAVTSIVACAFGLLVSASCGGKVFVDPPSGDGGGGGGGGNLPTPTCSTCFGFCTDLASDAASCGACGKACGFDEICFGGKCVKTPCLTGQPCSGKCCGDTCCSDTEVCCGNTVVGFTCVSTSGENQCPAPLCAGSCP